MTDSPKIVGRRLKALRDHAGLNQEQFAETIGAGQSQWSQYETGKRPLTLEVAVELVRVYDVSLDWLFFGKAAGMPIALGHLARV